MAENSEISWTTHTFNPWIGCTKVAPGCTHCYAESFAKRYGKATWGPNGTRVVTSQAYWKQPIKWNREACQAEIDHEDETNLGKDMGRYQRPRVFCASLADVFEDWQGNMTGSGAQHDGPGELAIDNKRTRLATMNDIRDRLFKLIDSTPNLDWLLLTKRPENIRKMWSGKRRSNVWLGTSIANSGDLSNIKELIECRKLSPVLFASCEPLIGEVDLTRVPTGSWAHGKVDALSGHLCGEEPDEMYDYEADPNGWVRKPAGEWDRGEFGIDWVIAGGESGHGARPIHPDWARTIRDQCQAAGVAFHFKQWGEWEPLSTVDGRQLLPFGEYDVETKFGFKRVGKKAAGRLLDGREWNEFPGEVNANA